MLRHIEPEANFIHLILRVSLCYFEASRQSIDPLGAGCCIMGCVIQHILYSLEHFVTLIDIFHVTHVMRHAFQRIV